MAELISLCGQREEDRKALDELMAAKVSDITLSRRSQASGTSVSSSDRGGSTSSLGSDM